MAEVENGSAGTVIVCGLADPKKDANAVKKGAGGWFASPTPQLSKGKKVKIPSLD